MDMPSALQPLTVDVYFMNLIMNFLIGQHITLDIVMPPLGALPPQVRPPTLPDSWSHPQLSLVMQYLRQFQDQWPIDMKVSGHPVDRYKFRIMFCHLTFMFLVVYPLHISGWTQSCGANLKVRATHKLIVKSFAL